MGAHWSPARSRPEQADQPGLRRATGAGWAGSTVTTATRPARCGRGRLAAAPARTGPALGDPLPGWRPRGAGRLQPRTRRSRPRCSAASWPSTAGLPVDARSWDVAGPLDESLTYSSTGFFQSACTAGRPAAVRRHSLHRLHGAHKVRLRRGARRGELIAILRRHLAGDDRAAFERSGPGWARCGGSSGCATSGAASGCSRLACPSIALERAIVRRSRALHPAMAFMLELTTSRPAPNDVQQGATGWTVSGALAAFGHEGEPWTSRCHLALPAEPQLPLCRARAERGDPGPRASVAGM